MRKSGLTGDEAYALSKHGKTTEDLGPLKKELDQLKDDLNNQTNDRISKNAIDNGFLLDIVSLNLFENGWISTTTGSNVDTGSYVPLRVRTKEYVSKGFGKIVIDNTIICTAFRYQNGELKSYSTATEIYGNETFDYKLVFEKPNGSEITPVDLLNHVHIYMKKNDYFYMNADVKKERNIYLSIRDLSIEQGGLNTTTGVESTSTKRCRSEKLYLKKGSVISTYGTDIVFVPYIYSENGIDYPKGQGFIDIAVDSYAIPEDGCYRFAFAHKTEKDVVPANISVFGRLLYPDYEDIKPIQTQGAIRTNDGLDIPANSNLRTYPLHLKKGSIIVANDGFEFRSFEQKNFHGKSGLYNSDTDYHTSYIILHDCYLRLSIRKTDGSKPYPNDDSVIIKGLPIKDKDFSVLYADVFKNCEWYVCKNLNVNKIYSKTVADIYSLYDALVEKYPDVMSSVNLGKDQSNTYTIMQYAFRPNVPFVEWNNENDTSNGGIYYQKTDLPKIVTFTGNHGSEKPVVLAMYNFLYNMLENWESDPILEYLRFNVQIIIVPILNPWGFTHMTRWNSRHININRNFDTNLWQNGDSNTSSGDYRGESKASEAETKIAQNVIKENSDAVAVFDWHTYGQTDKGYSKMTKFEIDITDGSDICKQRMTKLGMMITGMITKSGWKNHNLPKNSGFIGEVGGVVSKSSTLGSYGNLSGIDSASPEVMYKYYDGIVFGSTDDELTDDVSKLNVEYIGNTFYRFINILSD